jgi:hypothetical protein
MTTALSCPPVAARRSSSRRDAQARRPAPSSIPAGRGEGIAIGRPLAGYLDTEGRARELLAIPGHAGSTLVLDRDAVTLCDRRLVAHLAADEPCENVGIVCRHYLADTNGHWCRRVRPEDLESAPFAQGVCDGQGLGASSSRTHNHLRLEAHMEDRTTFAIAPGEGSHKDPRVRPCQAGDIDDGIRGGAQADIEALVFDRKGNAYCLATLAGEGSTPQLRWCMRRADADDDRWKQTALRDVVAALESYEPMRALTERAVASHRYDRGVLVTRVCCELERLYESPVVLNRALREAVLGAIDRHGMSMSEIALRCGIVKRDRRGKVSGETSWLARRVGIMPEGGETEITPWVHSDVLATIARKGLGISPREVELQ